MTTKLDASGDLGYVQLHKLAELFGPLPEYVKQASETETLAPEGLLPGSYADSLNRQFPVHTKAATYTSALYFINNVLQFPADRGKLISARLGKAAREHGILSDLQKLVQREQELAKSAAPAALPDSCFAFVSNGAFGKDRRYPLRNANEIKAAAAWFAQHRDHFVFADRQRMAERILDKAAEFSLRLDDNLDYLLEKQAGRGVYDPAVAAAQLRMRASLIKAADVKVGLHKMAVTLESDPLLAEDPATTADFASVVDAVDRLHGIKYGQMLKRPEDFLFAGSLKQASMFVKNACPSITGAIYSQDQLASLSYDQVERLFGQKAGSLMHGLEVDGKKVAALVADLPLDKAIRFDDYMRTCGIEPVHTKASSAMITPEDRRQLAVRYEIEQREMARAS